MRLASQQLPWCVVTAMRRYTTFLWALTIVIVVLLLVIPTMVGTFLRYGSRPPVSLKANLADAEGWQHVIQGYSLEGEGLADKAIQEYGLALSTKSGIVRNEALSALQRLGQRREALGPLSSTVSLLARLSATLRAPVVLLSLVLLPVLISRWCLRGRRTGTQIAQFSIYGSRDPLAAQLFQNAIIRFSDEIKRAYGSDLIRRLGLTVPSDVFQGTAPSDDYAREQAFAEAWTLEPKAITGFALKQLVRWIVQVPNRPAVLVTGSVQMLSAGAQASACVRDFRKREDIAINATTAEFDVLQRQSKVAHRLLPTDQPLAQALQSKDGEDFRRTCGELNILALVLACKIYHRRLQDTSSTRRPSSWETVCLFAAAAATLR